MTTPARIVTILSVGAGIFFAGYFANRQENASTSSASPERRADYTCPMHPQYRSDRTGDCPICGMRLRPAGAATQLHPANDDHPGMVQISAARQQLIGVRAEEVTLSSSSHLLRLPGRIAVDDQRLYRIIAAADGWIVDLRENPVGRFVRKDQLLASYYQKDLLYTERLFLLSIPADEALPSQKADFSQASIRTAGAANPQFPVDSLRSLGMSDLQIADIHRTRTASPHIGIYAPVSGYVLARSISPGQRFEKGAELYRIADISRVWVVADVFEKDLQFVKPGATATVRYRGREFHARVSESLPQLDPQTRTLKTRFELDNPDRLLLPDMFVDVEAHVDMPAALLAPADSVIDHGRRKTVYVAGADGTFEPRIVETGWRLGDRVQITSGLQPGERVVVAGQFLIDSESRMKLGPAAEGPPPTTTPAAGRDPVCGMDVDALAAGAIKVQRDGRTYYFCSHKCRADFEADPSKYAPKPPSPGNEGGNRGSF